MQATISKLLKAEHLRHEAESALVAVLCEAAKDDPNLAMIRRHAEKSFDALTDLHRAQSDVRRRTIFLLRELRRAQDDNRAGNSGARIG